MFVWLHSGIGRGQISEVRIIPVEISKVLSAYIMAKAPPYSTSQSYPESSFYFKGPAHAPQKKF
jgi:hypothetical protein